MKPNAKHDDIPLSALAQCAREAGVTVPGAVLPGLADYLQLLCRWNRAMNLVGARHWRDAMQRLVADSFHLADFLDGLPLPEEPLCWDLGSGAGLPAIPLRMVWRRGTCWLVEAREKRALFLSTVLARVPLPGTRVFRGRVEHFFPQQARKADCITSRAFMPWPSGRWRHGGDPGPRGTARRRGHRRLGAGGFPCLHGRQRAPLVLGPAPEGRRIVFLREGAPLPMREAPFPRPLPSAF